MQLADELFFSLFSIVIVVAVVWFIRNARRFKAWAAGRDESDTNG